MSTEYGFITFVRQLSLHFIVLHSLVSVSVVKVGVAKSSSSSDQTF